MSIASVIFVCALVSVTDFGWSYQIKTVEELKNARGTLLSKEFYRSTGHNVTLDENEKIVNKIMMDLKYEEIRQGYLHPDNWVTSNPLSEVLDAINKSKLFGMIQSMPKGGILHAHDAALGSTKTFIKLTYAPHTWICFVDEDSVLFAFAKDYPKDKCSGKWKLMETLRKAGNFSDESLIGKFSIQTKTFENTKEVWKHFIKTFVNTDNLMEYKPNFEEYVRSFLKECLDDGVQYMEIRSGVPELFDIDGNMNTKEETIMLIQEILKEFKSKNPDFIDMKIIYGKNRRKSATKTLDYLNETLTLSKKFPELIIGFDLVNQEDEGYSLLEHAPLLLNQPLNYFFHAGETNWFGTTVDENLIDAVLLGTKRIGHGYALTKHPEIKEMVKLNDICVEISPISNKMLHYVKDLRNHPVASFIADDVPIVISSDDPSFFNTAPLSHDFYMTFVGIASAHSDLRFLKQLAINSIKYSGMSEDEKTIAHRVWSKKWNNWIMKTIEQHHKIPQRD
ncbi:CECR1.2 family protein [Megaselia abdita]